MEQPPVETMDSEDLRAVLRGDDASVKAFLHLLSHPADIAEAITAVEPKEWPRLLRLIPDDELRAEVVALLDEPEQLSQLLPREEILPLLREMDSDDAADLLAELPPEQQREALQALPEEDRAEVEALLQYPEDSAGGIMQVERVQVRKDATVEETIEKVREMVDEGMQVHRVYVVDDGDKLVGSFDPVNLLFHKPKERIERFIEPVVATATPLMDQEQVAAIFRKYDLVSLPVIDDEGRLIGCIVHDDIVDVLDEEAEEDVLRMGGTDAEELLYRDRALAIARVRLPWLVVNLIGSLFSGAIIRFFEPVLAEALVLASFLPVIAAMGGNVGTQSATIMTRGFGTGRVTLADVPRTFFREIRVGVIMGLVCGLGVGLVAALFFGGRVYLGLVVFLAMTAAMTVAAGIGALAPAAMKRLNIDPAIASGPFVTTANDITGIVIYMSMAFLFLEKLR